MRRASLVLLLATACPPTDDEQGPDEPVGPDLTEALGSGEARAGVISDPAALFGGVAAEGRPGDVKIYNDRVRFVIQGVRDGSYYVDQGGVVLDADVVRPAGEPGHDVVDEWMPMVGLGRVLLPTKVEVVADGSDGGPAIVRAEGIESPMDLLGGAVELPELVRLLGVTITHEYVLQPDSWLLEVTTTVTAGAETDPEAETDVTDLIFGAPERAWAWTEGAGLDRPSGSRPFTLTGYVAHDARVAVATLPATEATFTPSDAAIISELAAVAIASGPKRPVPPGTTASWTRYWGVGPDLATLTDAAQAARGEATLPLEGVVVAADGRVAGARVAVLVDGTPFTEAVTDADGAFRIQVPADADATAVAIGRGTGLFVDLPDGAGSWGPYAHEDANALAAASWEAEPGRRVEGRGVGSPDDPLTLGVPGRLVVRTDDGLPFTVLADAVDDLPPIDARFAPRVPGGRDAVGLARDGEVSLLVPPGTYDLVVHRGARYEVHTERVVVEAGDTSTVRASLPAAFEHEGWVLADPHSHASASSDADTAMEDRLLAQAASGIQLHFGTDHDHVVDYRPIVTALGLDGVLASIPADEVSPPLRGHFNIYPVEPRPELANGGAWRWWKEIPETTDQMVDFLRARHGDAFVIQANHPDSSGVASSAGWSPGRVRQPDRWTEAFEAVEVMNAGGLDGWELYHDLTARGRQLTPVGVSDAHGHLSGRQGLSATWLHVGVDDPSEVDFGVLVDAMRRRATVVSGGVFLDCDVLPGTEVSAGTQVAVVARTPSWVVVDRLRLLRDGVEVEVVDGAEATFTLSPDADAAFVVVAEGDRAMAPVESGRPWAMTAAWRVDVGGDGWTPPLPPTR